MVNEKSVYSEVRQFVAGLVDMGAETPVEWITTHFLNSRGQIRGEGEVLYRYCARAHVSQIVKKVVGKYDVAARTAQDDQISLPGFEFLQKAYTFSRDEKIVLIPIHKCSDDELLARAAEYRKLAQGCEKHAVELEAFVRSRHPQGRLA